MRLLLPTAPSPTSTHLIPSSGDALPRRGGGVGARSGDDSASLNSRGGMARSGDSPGPGAAVLGEAGSAAASESAGLARRPAGRYTWVYMETPPTSSTYPQQPLTPPTPLATSGISFCSASHHA